MTSPSWMRDRSLLLVLSFVVFLIIGAANLIELIFVVPKFEQIFQDALPGKPLPDITLFFIGYRFVIALMVATWIGLCAYLFAKRNKHAILAIILGAIWTYVQGAVIVIAMCMPMIGTTTGMSPTSS